MDANFDVVDRDLNRHLAEIDLEEWFDELEELGFPPPCLRCRWACMPSCKYWDVRP